MEGKGRAGGGKPAEIRDDKIGAAKSHMQSRELLEDFTGPSATLCNICVGWGGTRIHNAKLEDR